jgi:predicted dehydrogenase
MNDPIRYAIVGLGRSGWDIHVKALRGRADARIVAVVDPIEDRRAEAAKEFGCKAYASIDEVLRQPDVEVVVIATPSVQHAPDARRALRAGKHVLLEKPIAMNLAEADSLLRTAEKSGKHLFAHHNARYNRLFTHLQDVVKSGVLGQLFHMRHYQQNFARRSDWQTLRKNGGGVLNNTCPHFIDHMIQLAGAPVKLAVGDLRQIASAGDVEDHVNVFFRFENGVTANMEISSAENVALPLPRWILCGTHGTLTTDGTTSTIRYVDPKQVSPTVLPAVDGHARDRKYGNDDKLPWQEKTVPSEGPDHGSIYDNVRAVLRENKPLHITPRQAREVIRATELARAGTEFPGTQPLPIE